MVATVLRGFAGFCCLFDSVGRRLTLFRRVQVVTLLVYAHVPSLAKFLTAAMLYGPLTALQHA